MIYGHGDDIYRYGEKIRHNFSTNIYNGFDLSGLKEHLSRNADTITSYPEPVASSVETLLSNIKNIDKKCVMVTNGATEAIYIIAQCHHESRSLILSPTFSEYADACMMHSIEVNYAPTLPDSTTGIDIIWLCNPNNPTGKTFDKETLITHIDRHPSALYVIDQAYADYTLKPVITEREAVERENVILLGSLTKRFGIPGLRVGYAIGSHDVIDKLKRHRMPWSVNSLAIEGAKYLLNHRDKYIIDAQNLNAEARRIASEFEKIVITTHPTDCNILLCKLPKQTSAQLKDYLVGRYGILIRDASNFHGLDSRYFRIASQSPSENDLLIKSVASWIKHS